jgi:cystathionine beta-lyase/cystathionine gamma-synthase
LFHVECINMLKDMTDEAKKEMLTATKEPSFVFSSGMMGVTSILLAHSSPLTVLLPDDVYHCIRTLLHEVFHRHHVHVRPADMRNPKSVVDAIAAADPSHDVIVWMESPSNPKCHVLDIQSICEAVHSMVSTTTHNRKVTTVVDGTMSSPILTRPLEVRESRRGGFVPACRTPM